VDGNELGRACSDFMVRQTHEQVNRYASKESI
jgi:hypothetical protein